MTDSLQKFLTTHNIPPLTYDGVIHRYGPDNSEWAVGYEHSGYVTIIAGSWRTRDKKVFRSEVPESERKAVEEAWEQAAKEAEERRQAMYEKAAEEAKVIWQGAMKSGSSLYLDRKGITTGLHGLRLLHQDGEWLLICPVQNLSGDIIGLQSIYPNGQKSFLLGTQLKGSLLTLPVGADWRACDRVLVCEGVATGLSLYEATGQPVVVAWNCGNLPNVVGAIRRELGPDRLIVVCADDDWKTEEEKGFNPGRDAAKECKSKYATRVALPKWKGMKKGTDWNDLHVHEGKETVKTQIDAASASRELARALPMEGRKTPDHMAVVDHFLKWCSDNEQELSCCQDELFRWVGTHWERLTEQEESRLELSIAHVFGPGATDSVVGAIMAMLRRKLKASAKSDLLLSRPKKANFKNGTLSIVQAGGTWEATLSEHKKEDGLTYCLPFDLPVGKKFSPGPFYQHIVETYGEEYVMTIQEMMGSALLPIFPRAFFFTGPPATGKSTLARLIDTMLEGRYVSSVSPHNFTGFGMEPLIGALVNICNDLDTKKRLPDDIMKVIFEGDTLQVNRKMKRELRIQPPALHIFTSNGLPRTEETSGAFERRIIIIPVERKPIDKQNVVLGYDKILWANHKEEIVLFAMEGLMRLTANLGRYTIPKTNDNLLREWADMEDPVSLYLEYIREGASHLLSYDEANRHGADLHDIYADYCDYCKKTGFRVSGHRSFVVRLRSLGLTVYRGSTNKTKVAQIYKKIGPEM